MIILMEIKKREVFLFAQGMGNSPFFSCPEDGISWIMTVRSKSGAKVLLVIALLRPWNSACPQGGY